MTRIPKLLDLEEDFSDVDETWTWQDAAPERQRQILLDQMLRILELHLAREEGRLVVVDEHLSFTLPDPDMQLVIHHWTNLDGTMNYYDFQLPTEGSQEPFFV